MLRQLTSPAYFPVISVEQDLDIRMIEHVLEHAGEAVQRHRLVSVGKVPVVAIHTHRDARGNGSIEFRGIHAPLFPGVIAEELLIQLTANTAYDDVFGGSNRLAFFRDLVEKSFCLERIQS